MFEADVVSDTNLAVGLDVLAAVVILGVKVGLKEVSVGLKEVAVGLKEVAVGLKEVAVGLKEVAVGVLFSKASTFVGREVCIKLGKVFDLTLGSFCPILCSKSGLGKVFFIISLSKVASVLIGTSSSS